MKKVLTLFSLILLVGVNRTILAQNNTKDSAKSRLVKLAEEREKAAEKIRQEEILAQKKAAKDLKVVNKIEESDDVRLKEAKHDLKVATKAEEYDARKELSKIDDAMKQLEAKVDAYVQDEKK